MWLIAGPNGSGKTTLANWLQRNGGVSEMEDCNWINPDDILNELVRTPNRNERNASNVFLEAAQLADARMTAFVASGTSFVRETVLSTERLKPIVERALSQGFNFGFIFVSLRSAEDSIERVRLRVKQGGHAVAENRIRARWPRSVANVSWFAAHAEVALIYDNSEIDNPILLYERRGERWFAHSPGRIIEVDVAIRPLLTAGRIP